MIVGNYVQRNYGIDLLRIISMIFIVCLHVLGHGGVLESLGDACTLKYSIAWLLEIVAYPAVNIFVIISGFVGYRGEKVYPKFKNLISLYMQVVFYGLLLTLILKFVLKHEISTSEFIKSIIPITTGRYWFFTSYSIMLLFSPLVNNFVHKTSKNDIFVALLISIVILSVYSMLIFRFNNPMFLNQGRSFLWFLELYFLGCVIKKYDLSKVIQKRKVSGVFIMFFLLLYVPKLLNGCNLPNMLLKLLTLYDKIVFSYNSVLVLGLAICMVLFFSSFEPKKSLKLIRFLSPLCFGVYLIHDNILIRQYLMMDWFGKYTNNNVFVLIAVVVFSVLTIFQFAQ